MTGWASASRGGSFETRSVRVAGLRQRWIRDRSATIFQSAHSLDGCRLLNGRSAEGRAAWQWMRTVRSKERPAPFTLAQGSWLWMSLQFYSGGHARVIEPR